MRTLIIRKTSGISSATASRTPQFVMFELSIVLVKRNFYQATVGEDPSPGSCSTMNCLLTMKAEEGLPTSDFGLPTSDFRLLTSDFRLPTSDFRLPTSDFRLPTSDFRLLFLPFFFLHFFYLLIYFFYLFLFF